MPCQRDGYVGAILVIALLDYPIKSGNDRIFTLTWPLPSRERK
jgi:hypothetical protein